MWNKTFLFNFCLNIYRHSWHISSKYWKSVSYRNPVVLMMHFDFAILINLKIIISFLRDTRWCHYSSWWKALEVSDLKCNICLLLTETEKWEEKTTFKMLTCTTDIYNEKQTNQNRTRRHFLRLFYVGSLRSITL